jgi:hypothetical protein
MTTLDDFFSRQSDFLHPRLRNWKARLGEPGASATVEVFRPKSDLGQAQPEISLQFTRNGELLPLETVAWDDDLNTGLIQLRVRAVSLEQEAERFALGLPAGPQKAERELGNGYFNAALVELLRDSDLTRYSEIAEVLRYLSVNRPSRESKALEKYTTCRELIADAISGSQ